MSEREQERCDRVFFGSKYAQVVVPREEWLQIWRDAWQAALADRPEQPVAREQALLDAMAKCKRQQILFDDEGRISSANGAEACFDAIDELRTAAPVARPEPLEQWRDDELADSPTPRAQEGTWTLTAPDGRTWKADSPLRCAAAETNDRVPADVQLARIARSIADDRPEPAQPMAHEPVGMVVDNEAALFDRFKGKLGNDTLLYTAPPSRPAPSEAEAERQSKSAAAANEAAKKSLKLADHLRSQNDELVYALHQVMSLANLSGDFPEVKAANKLLRKNGYDV